jgi:hypothetical protein
MNTATLRLIKSSDKEDVVVAMRQPILTVWIDKARGATVQALETNSRSLSRKASRRRRQEIDATASIIDSQVVCTAGDGGESGYDADKQITSRRRHGRLAADSRRAHKVTMAPI